MVQQRVAQEEQKRVDILRRIGEFDQVIEQAFADQQDLMAQPKLDVSQLGYFPTYVWRLKSQRFQEHQQLQLQERKLAEVRADLKEAMVRKKSLEVLKDKDYIKYKKRIEKAEEEFLAELALNRRFRQQQATG